MLIIKRRIECEGYIFELHAVTASRDRVRVIGRNGVEVWYYPKLDPETPMRGSEFNIWVSGFLAGKDKGWGALI